MLAHVPQMITGEMNSSLTHEFRECEVLAALQQMASLKTVGLEGMPPFLPTLLEHSGQGCYLLYFVMAKYKYLTSSHKSNLYYTQPKTNNPEYVHRFHPISFCNVLYKIFSKVLANHLKNLLPTIITEHQSAFTKDMLISNNILVTFETLHCLHKYNSGSSKFMALKLDMTKAYD